MMITQMVILLLAACGFGYIAKKIPVLPGGLRILIWLGLLIITIFIATIMMSLITGGTLVN